MTVHEGGKILKTELKQWIGWVTAAVLIVGLSMGGCATVGTLDSRARGEYYLSRGQHQEGLTVFRSKIEQNPNDPWARYYAGRFLLAEKRAEEALPQLERAVELRPNDADFHFWLGVGYWSVLDFERERQSYQKALSCNPNHVPAHVYLGHNYLDRGEAQKALSEYDTALKLEPAQPDALFNRAMALRKLDRKAEEVPAWKNYLDRYPDGALARRAADNLNARGDYSYRNHVIGIRVMTLGWIKFNAKTDQLDPSAEPSLRVVGSILSINKNIKLQIASYYKGDLELAKARAAAVKAYILAQFPDIIPDRLKIRSYSIPERVVSGKKVFALNHSIAFSTVK